MEKFSWLDDFLEGKIDEDEVERKANNANLTALEMLAVAVAFIEHRETRESHQKRKNSFPPPPPAAISKEERLIREKSLKKPMIIIDETPPLLVSNQGRFEIGSSSAFNCSSDDYSARKKKKKRTVNHIVVSSDSLTKPKKTQISKKKQQQQNKSKKIIITYRGPKTPPPLPYQFIDKIAQEGGTDTKLVIQKPLYPSDVSHHHDRLLMPLSQIVSKDFLTDEEKANFKSKVVTLLDTELKSAQIRFTRWNMKSNIMYILNSKWKDLVDSNKLKCGNIVQVWSFRVGLELRLALVLVEQGQAAS